MGCADEVLKSDTFPEKVYAGVLGKIIGVYLGRPFEQWSHERIESELGEITGYVHDKLGVPLVVTDDDITGTFTFVRALIENRTDKNLTPAQIGDWWLNTIIEKKSILWWGGMGISTEHTAYLRLREGIRAPASGSLAVNGKTVAEQIGAQIFIDGWAMVCAGDPDLAVDFARRAGSVSHDGEAIYGAQIIAAMEALAFVETDINTLLDRALTYIPPSSLITTMIVDVRRWVKLHGDDWRLTLHNIVEKYGYQEFRGACHIVPNHAVIIMALLHGAGNFERSMMIVNTAGYDTDCNAANVGCLLGIRSGLAAFDGGTDWRGPVADRVMLPTADGGRCISDALRESTELVKAARTLAGLPAPAPKNGARFHFSQPGAVQGFQVVEGTAKLTNLFGALTIKAASDQRLPSLSVITTPTLPSAKDRQTQGYNLSGCPTLYSGQRIRAALKSESVSSQPIEVRLIALAGYEDERAVYSSEPCFFGSGESKLLEWSAPDSLCLPFQQVGLEAVFNGVGDELTLEWLTWDGAPTLQLKAPKEKAQSWKDAWVSSADEIVFGDTDGVSPFLVVNNRGVGMAQFGDSSWTNYVIKTTITPNLCNTAGIASYVQGLNRYVAVSLRAGYIFLEEHWDTHVVILAAVDRNWIPETEYDISLSVRGSEITAEVDKLTLNGTLVHLEPKGSVGLLVGSGNANFGTVSVQPL